MNNDVQKYSEHDLYTPLIRYLHDSEEFSAYAKITDPKGQSAIKAPNGESNKWLSPDVIAFRFSHKAFKKIGSLSSFVPTGAFLSFEVKKELTASNYVESFSECHHNSSWANETYLVAEKIAPEISSEVKRLCGVFNLGLIKLNITSPDQSEIIIQSPNKNIDYLSLEGKALRNIRIENFLYAINELSNIGSKHFTALLNESYEKDKIDKHLDDEKYAEYAEERFQIKLSKETDIEDSIEEIEERKEQEYTLTNEKSVQKDKANQEEYDISEFKITLADELQKDLNSRVIANRLIINNEEIAFDNMRQKGSWNIGCIKEIIEYLYISYEKELFNLRDNIENKDLSVKPNEYPSRMPLLSADLTKYVDYKTPERYQKLTNGLYYFKNANAYYLLKYMQNIIAEINKQIPEPAQQIDTANIELYVRHYN